jgi:hypothetical protein
MEQEPMDLNAWSEHVLSIAAERFERRLAQEIAGLRVELMREMHAGFASIRQEMANQRVELLKWPLVFWVGQFAAFTAVLSFMLRR